MNFRESDLACMSPRTTSDYFTIEQLEVGLKFAREYFDSWHKQDSSIAKADHDPDVRCLENLLDWRKTVLRLREVNWTDLAAHLEVRADYMESMWRNCA